jgi:hypothetical protein
VNENALGTPDVFGFNGSVTCPCGLLRLYNVKLQPGLTYTVSSRCPYCGAIVEVAPDDGSAES